MAMIRSAGALSAGLLGLANAAELVGTEAGSGQLTGPLADLCLAGGVALVVCSALLFTGRPIVRVLTILATVLPLPLLIYRVAPLSLGWLAAAPPSVEADHSIIYDPLAMASIVALLAVDAMCARPHARLE